MARFFHGSAKVDVGFPGNVAIQPDDWKTMQKDAESKATGSSSTESSSGGLIRPRDFYDAIRPLAWANRVIGLGSFGPSDSVRQLFGQIAYSILCIALYASLLKFVYIYAHPAFVRKTTKLGDITFKALAYCNIILTICLVISGWLGTKNVKKTMLRICECDKVMDGLGITKNYRAFFISQIVYLGCIILAIAGFVTINYKWMFISHTPFGMKVLLGICVHYPTIFMCIANISFFCWVRYSGMRFKSINERLRGLLTTTSQSPQHKRVLQMKYDRNNICAPSSAERSARTNDDVQMMKAAKQIHLELVKSAKLINDAYGLQLLLTMSTSFVLITGLLYDAYTILWLNLSTEELLRELVPVGCWLIFYSSLILSISHACATTSAESANTGDIICELYEPSTSKEFRGEIRDFTLQLIQNPLSYTACGFFDLDHTFIHGVIGSITTYLVILIQVGDMPKSNSANHTTIANGTINQISLS
ncbi:hypothetical protein KM043_018084 [Ampulex compressa]|nr:hypothetical protein KM043_018084 [Ampulex compressa]